jgi:glutathione transport system permease protein
MIKLILKRILNVIPVLLIVSFLVFMMVHAMPGDPARVIAGDSATAEDIERVRVAHGFDKPIMTQYFTYMKNIFRGDFGTSFKTGRPVIDDISIRAPNTLLLASGATLIAIIFGVAVGLISATKRNSLLDNICMTLALIGLSTPPFYLGMMLMLIVCVRLQWLPITAEVSLIGLILPAITLSARSLATIARMTRSSMLEVFSQGYILTARAQGFNEKKIIFGHALKNSMNSIITVAGLQFGSLLGGSVITEKIYGWPGLGELIINGIKARDFPVVQMSILVIASAFVLVNLVIDILYVIINPRIKLV